MARRDMRGIGVGGRTVVGDSRQRRRGQQRSGAAGGVGGPAERHGRRPDTRQAGVRVQVQRAVGRIRAECHHRRDNHGADTRQRVAA